MTTFSFTRIRLTLMLAILLSSIMYINAQTKITAFGSVGITEVQVSGLGVLDVDPYIKPITQYTAGIQYERNLNPNLSFVTGGQFSSRGFGMKENINIDLFGLDLPIGASIETRLTYLEVPALLKYEFGDGGVTPYVKAGASAAYAIDGKIQPKVNAIITWKLPAININLENDMYNRFDVSGIVGAGLNLPVGETGAVQFEVNYRHSLNDMFLDNITDIKIKSHGISAGLGYTMRF